MAHLFVFVDHKLALTISFPLVGLDWSCKWETHLLNHQNTNPTCQTRGSEPPVSGFELLALLQVSGKPLFNHQSNPNTTAHRAAPEAKCSFRPCSCWRGLARLGRRSRPARKNLGVCSFYPFFVAKESQKETPTFGVVVFFAGPPKLAGFLVVFRTTHQNGYPQKTSRPYRSGRFPFKQVGGRWQCFHARHPENAAEHVQRLSLESAGGTWVLFFELYAFGFWLHQESPSLVGAPQKVVGVEPQVEPCLFGGCYKTKSPT